MKNKFIILVADDQENSLNQTIASFIKISKSNRLLIGNGYIVERAKYAKQIFDIREYRVVGATVHDINHRQTKLRPDIASIDWHYGDLPDNIFESVSTKYLIANLNKASEKGDNRGEVLYNTLRAKSADTICIVNTFYEKSSFPNVADSIDKIEIDNQKVFKVNKSGNSTESELILENLFPKVLKAKAIEIAKNDTLLYYFIKNILNTNENGKNTDRDLKQISWILLGWAEHSYDISTKKWSISYSEGELKILEKIISQVKSANLPKLMKTLEEKGILRDYFGRGDKTVKDEKIVNETAEDLIKEYYECISGNRNYFPDYTKYKKGISGKGLENAISKGDSFKDLHSKIMSLFILQRVHCFFAKYQFKNNTHWDKIDFVDIRGMFGGREGNLRDWIQTDLGLSMKNESIDIDKVHSSVRDFVDMFEYPMNK